MSVVKDEDMSITPPEIRDIAEIAVSNILPDKSRLPYEKQYNKFLEWCNENKINDVSEKVLLAYFESQRKKYKASTLWTTYSMLKSCISVYKEVDISKYHELQALLKRSSEGYVPKKSKILEEEDINRFIQEADDRIYLAMKVILIMGYNGACRREELVNMSVADIEYKANSIIVTVAKTKNNVPRNFAVTNKKWINLIHKYANLRPSNVPHWRFFLTYRKGRCINSPIGINIMGKVSKEIATYLNLPSPELFTGHCFRRSSATHLTPKRPGGWKPSVTAEDCVETSLTENVEVSQTRSRSQNNLQLPGCSSFQQNIVTAENLPTVTINAQDSTNRGEQSGNISRYLGEMSTIDITIRDFENICRTCLSRENLKPLYENCVPSPSLAQMLMACTLVKFEENDGLPLNICTNCINEIRQAFTFAKRCETTDAILRKCVTKIKIESADTPSEIILPIVEKIQENFEFVQVKVEDTEENDLNIEYEDTYDDPADESDDDQYFMKSQLANSSSASQKEEAKQEAAVKKKFTLEKVPEDFEHVEEEYEETFDDHTDSNQGENYDENPDKSRSKRRKRTNSSNSENYDEDQDETYSKKSTRRRKVSPDSYSKANSGAPPFACDVCGRVFKLLTQLKDHNLIHTGKKRIRTAENPYARTYFT